MQALIPARVDEWRDSLRLFEMPNADGADLPHDEEKSWTIKTLTVLLEKLKRERSHWTDWLI